MPPSIPPTSSYAQDLWASTISTPKKILGVPSSIWFLVFGCFKDQERKIKKKKKKEDQGEDQRLIKDPDVI